MDAPGHVTAENAMDTAGMLCGINSVPMGARWRATEAFNIVSAFIYRIHRYQKQAQI